MRGMIADLPAHVRLRGAAVASNKSKRAQVLTRGDAVFMGVTWVAAFLVLASFVGMFAVLLQGSWPALSHFGLPFFVTKDWNPVKERFGILALIYGTLVTSALAMLFAVPIGIGIAIFLTELC